MVALLIQHIDGIIMGFIGALFAIGVWKPDEITARNNFVARNIRVLGVGMLVCGALMILTQTLATLENWQRVYTADKKASAEFPFKTTSETQTETDGKAVVQKTITRCRYPHQQLELALVQTERSPKDQLLHGEEWILFLEDHLQSQGANIVALDKKPFGDFFGYHVVLESKDGKGRTTTRGVLTPTHVFELATASTPNRHNDPAIQKFMDSFLLDKTISAKPTPPSTPPPATTTP